MENVLEYIYIIVCDRKDGDFIGCIIEIQWSNNGGRVLNFC